MTTFTPTHRTTRDIGLIEEGSEILVARYDDHGYFLPVLSRLGIDTDLVRYHYCGQDVNFRTSHGMWYMIYPDDYVITDGYRVEVARTDSGWDLLPAETSKPEGVSLSAWGDNLYTLRGDTGSEIKVTTEQLRILAQAIQERIPEPSPIENARFITAFHQIKGEYQVLAKFDDLWYDNNGFEHTEKQVLEDYDEIGVIR